MRTLICFYDILCFFFLLHFQVTWSQSSEEKLCHPDQSSALLQFKKTLSLNSSASVECDEYFGITSHPKTASWKEGTHCCSWDGVICDGLKGDVIGLDLSCRWLHGKIHFNSTLFRLPHLQKLNLAHNDFSDSPISSGFAKLSSLTHLNLSYCLFTGPIPSEISQLSKLVSLDLRNNDELPVTLMKPSSSLTTLSLKSCNLQGNIPDDIFHFPNLRILNLWENADLFGSFPKSNWRSPLVFLTLAFTSFSGELPSSIGNLRSLQSLDLQSCNFTGSIPASLGNWTQITYIDLQFNNFTGLVPFSFSNLKQLTYLDLSHKKFIGQFPDVFSNFSRLCTIILSQNDFNDQLPSSVFNSTQILLLDFSNSQMGSPIPSHTGGLTYLTELYLNRNLLNGTIPPWLYNLSSLIYLDLNTNQLTGRIQSFLHRTLLTLDLSKNKLQGPVPSSIFELSNLTQLDLSSNNLSGTVNFNMVSKLKELVYLDLSNNSLSVSTNINANSILPKFKLLRLSSCNISEFPGFLVTLEDIQELDLSNNRIHGHVPKFLWEMGKESLYHLNLSHNSLTSIERLPWGT
ncbi:hypothetical protein FNV43_RR11605 [Rhamnella rubrinervis]|uniref:Leucine-rich repeat-containing N-terminal plant-type domain-containing protein n=1 Tax=Rhamnella rubrinervis TaxID=2594499 RepID=A0A8K0H629_9ROSA|nr:hypothetical protein FNV43_RR11605 [Rhamnella rubrinervis]